MELKTLFSILKQLNGIFWTVDKDLVFTSSFGGGLKKLGLTENQVIGQNLFQYFKTEDRNFEPIRKHLQALEGENVQYDLKWNNHIWRTRLQPQFDENGGIIGVIGFALDVTDEITFLESLKFSEEKYRALFESAKDAIFLMDKELFIDCNDATLKLFDCNREDIIGEPPYKFSPPTQPDGRDSKEKALELINRTLNGEKLTFEWVHTKLNGTPFYTEVSLNKINLKDSNYILAIVRDITEKKKYESEIKLLAYALESVNECVSITDKNDKLIYINKKFEEVYGYTRDELIGKPITILRSEKNAPEIIKDILPKTLEGGWLGELWNKRKNGEDFVIRLSTAPVLNEEGEIVGLIGVASDITREKELLNKIKYDSERLRILFENAPDAIFICDYDGRIVEANKVSEELVGWTKEEALNKSMFELKIFDKSNFRRAARVFYNAIKGNPTGPDEMKIKTRNGETVYIEVTTYPVTIDDKKLILCIARNINERKRIMTELARAKEQAEEANKKKTIFFASMSHELKAPLNSIIGFTEVLKDIFYEKSEPQIRHYFDIIQNASKTLLNTIIQLLDLTRIESGLFQYQIKELNFKEIIESAINLLQHLAEQKGLQIQTEFPEEKIIVNADEYTLNGILTNVLSNAIKYSDKGTIRIKVDKDKNDGYASCEIKDEGIGMSEEFQKKLFQHFTREASYDKKKREGTGLGLALTKKFIEINKGQIEIKSKKGEGTTVIFKIPLANSEKES